MDPVTVEISYCTPCGYKSHFDEMSRAIKQQHPQAQIIGQDDKRSGAFEVSINGKSVHSRLQTLSFPNYEASAEIVQKVANGGDIPGKLPQQPINDCKIS